MAPKCLTGRGGVGDMSLKSQDMVQNAFCCWLDVLAFGSVLEEVSEILYCS